MRKRIAGSRLAIIEDAAHLCFAEQPADFSTIVNSFLTERAVVPELTVRGCRW
jgi:pimeloyl-ACP methyl ester carboxylesterase